MKQKGGAPLHLNIILVVLFLSSDDNRHVLFLYFLFPPMFDCLVHGGGGTIISFLSSNVICSLV